MLYEVITIASDVTTIINGQLQLSKRQSLDAACDGVEDGPFSTLDITTGAIPGACIRYEITVTNVGSTAVSNVVINDATPANTTSSNAALAATTQGTVITSYSIHYTKLYDSPTRRSQRSSTWNRRRSSRHRPNGPASCWPN